MPTPNDEFSPELFLVQAVIADAIHPRLRAFEANGIGPLIANLEILVREHVVDSFLITSSAVGVQGVQANGTIRVRFRRTGKPHRHLWRVESVFPSISPQTGFTGFNATGDVKANGENLQVRMKNWIGKYNIVNWHGWK